MRIIQVLPTISFGDAVGNDTIAIRRLLEKNGYKTEIYAENIDSRLPKGTAKKIEKLTSLKNEDVIIYHLSMGTKLNDWIKEQNCHKICVYHNITPSSFFQPYNRQLASLCEQGIEEIKQLKGTFDCVWAASEFNKKDLIKMGYHCPIYVLPILIPFEDYKKQANKEVIQTLEVDYVNILFVGRIAPNKKQEDVIAAFNNYHKYYNGKSRLFLVGSYAGTEVYYERLRDYVKRLRNSDVYFLGQVKFDEILAYYKKADIFLCMSEHEGFCVPLIEAMNFDVPIVAYDSSAIKYTLDNAGFLVKEKDPVLVAGVMNRIISDEVLRTTIIHNQRERLHAFDTEKVEQQLLTYLRAFLKQIQ